MSEAADIPQVKARNNGSPTTGNKQFLVPSPIITRRTRTKSVSETAKAQKKERGTVQSFCRNKGHGFIVPHNTNQEPLFVHISDLEGEYVPKEGDVVEYCSHTIPPKNEKLQAMHVQIIQPEGVAHETWNSPPPAQLSPSSSPRKH